MREKDMKDLIRNTFLKLYLKKGVEKIQVNEIIKDAHIGRSTFYKHYKNVYEILVEMEKTVIDDFDMIYKNNNYIDVCDLKDDMPAPNFYEMYKYIIKHKNFFIAAYSDHGNYLFKKERKKSITSKIESTYEKYFDDEYELKVFSDYISEIIIVNISLLLRYSDIFTPITMSIKTKNTIVNFIKNKDLYFKKIEN